MAGPLRCRNGLRWRQAEEMRRKTREYPLASCTFSNCRRLRGVALRPPKKQKIAQGRWERRGFVEKDRSHLLVRASTPGSLRPPRNSREAPPPVEMCEI